MIDTKELRRLVEEDGKNNIDLGEIHELLDCLEDAESECLEQARLNGLGASREAALMAKLEAAEKERDELRASVEWHQRRWMALQMHQTKMREPERTMVCDILANGELMHPTVAGDRYAVKDAQPAPSADCPFNHSSL